MIALGNYLSALAQIVTQNPSLMVPVLAFACAITAVIAITKDAVWRR